MRYAPVLFLTLLACSNPSGIRETVPPGEYYGRDARNFEIRCVVQPDGITVDSLIFSSSVYFATDLHISTALSIDYDTQPSCSLVVHFEAVYVPDSAHWTGYHECRYNGVPDPVPFTMERIGD